MTDSIVGTLINLGMVDDLKALLALAKAGVINRDVDTTKLILQTIKTKFGKMDELQTNKEIKELIRELIDLLEVVDELIEEDEDVFAESAEEETRTQKKSPTEYPAKIPPLKQSLEVGYTLSRKVAYKESRPL